MDATLVGEGTPRTVQLQAQNEYRFVLWAPRIVNESFCPALIWRDNNFWIILVSEFDALYESGLWQGLAMDADWFSSPP
jgi:hypothetical protein